MPERKVVMRLIHITTFFYALHYALTLYIESSYLGIYVPEKSVGLVYMIASLLSVLAAIHIPRILTIYGSYKTTLTLIVLEVISLFSLSISETASVVILLFIAHQIFLNSLFITVNVLLESFSLDESTGKTRGVFLTILNAAILAGPFTAGFFFGSGDFNSVFLIAACLTLPMFFLVAMKFSNYKDPIYKDFLFIKTLIEVFSDGSVYKISSIRFFLEVFYSVMVVYTPIYLNKYLGIPFEDILGAILPAALIPFVIFPYILGILADKKFGEKEMLTFGVIVISISTALISFMDTKSIAFWAGIMFVTRIGASFIEAMTETYFFKHVSATDSNLISFFSSLRPLAFMVGPLISTLFIYIFDIRYIFLGLSFLMIYNLKHSLTLRDTL